MPTSVCTHFPLSPGIHIQGRTHRNNRNNNPRIPKLKYRPILYQQYLRLRRHIDAISRFVKTTLPPRLCAIKPFGSSTSEIRIQRSAPTEFSEVEILLIEVGNASVPSLQQRHVPTSCPQCSRTIENDIPARKDVLEQDFEAVIKAEIYSVR